MDLVTTTGIKGKVFSPRKPNSYWMQSFCVIMLMLISGHSNLLKILKSRQSKKWKELLWGYFEDWSSPREAPHSLYVYKLDHPLLVVHHLNSHLLLLLVTQVHHLGRVLLSTCMKENRFQDRWEILVLRTKKIQYCSEGSGLSKSTPSSYSMLTTSITHHVFVVVFDCFSVGHVKSPHYSAQFSERSKASHLLQVVFCL